MQRALELRVGPAADAGGDVRRDVGRQHGAEGRVERAGRRRRACRPARCGRACSPPPRTGSGPAPPGRRPAHRSAHRRRRPAAQCRGSRRGPHGSLSAWSYPRPDIRNPSASGRGQVAFGGAGRADVRGAGAAVDSAAAPRYAPFLPFPRAKTKVEEDVSMMPTLHAPRPAGRPPRCSPQHPPARRPGRRARSGSWSASPPGAHRLTGRMFAQNFGEAWGQPVVVENIAGNSAPSAPTASPSPRPTATR